jgi:sortase A
MTRHKQSSKRTTISWLLISLGVLGLIVSFFLYLHQTDPPSSTITHGVDVTSAPSSVKPKPNVVASYTVPPTNPRYISIPAIGLSQSRVVELGLTHNNQIATPDNIYDTGWFNGSAKPGQNGAMFIYGHVSSWTANGAFHNLKKLRQGDNISITRGDGTTYVYQVVSSKVYPYNAVNMQEVLSPIMTNKPGLNLMTCTGAIIKGTSEFEKRLVVFTKLLSS